MRHRADPPESPARPRERAAAAAMAPLTAAIAAPPPALDTLMLPFADGSLDWPADSRVLFLRARDGAALRAVLRPGWVCVQGFRADHEALPAGVERLTEVPEPAQFPVVLLLPPRQREESRAWLARALDGVAPNGVLVVSQANDEGARSLQDDVQSLCGEVHIASKHKCRVIWVRPDPARIDTARLAAWRVLDAPRQIEAGYQSRPGLFSWDRIDAGSALLAANLPGKLHGRVADLGCGYGYLSCELLRRCPRVTAVDLYDAEARALPLARANVERVRDDLGRAVAIETHWHDVATGLPQRYHAIISNPPFHLDRGGLPQLGQAFIHAAARSLLPDGQLLLVANRHLPYEEALEARFHEWQVLAAGHGFKVIHARTPRR